MRRLLPSFLLTLLACTPTSAPVPLSAVPAPATASASAPLPHFDPARPDAVVLEMLARIPDPGPVESALNEASRRDLTKALEYIESTKKAGEVDLRTRQDIAEELKPLLWVATHPDDPQAVQALYSKGNTWRALRILRPQGEPSEDLLAGTRRLVTWAARAHAKVASQAGRSPVSAAEADQWVNLARVLEMPSLEAAASALAVQLEPTAARLSTSVYAAARDLKIEAAKMYLEDLRRKDLTSFEPWTISMLERDITRAEELQQLGGEQANRENAPEAASLAAHLQRYDFVEQILQRNKLNVESDLRLAVASVSSQINGIYCLGLEQAHEPQEICAAAWSQNPDRAAFSERLEHALASGKGKSPWAIETYLGITQILPLVYFFVGGQVSSQEQFLAALTRYRDGILKSLTVEGVSALQRDTISLFTDTLYKSTTAALDSASSNWKVSEANTRDLIRRAEEILQRYPQEFLAQQAALAVTMLLFRDQDTTPLLKKIPDTPRLIPARSHAAAFLGLLREDTGLVEEGLRGLEAIPAWVSPSLRPRSRLLALEVRAARSSSQTEQDALLHEVAAPFPETSDALDQLQRLIERVALLARQGHQEEIEQILDKTLKNIPINKADSSTLDLLGVLQTIAESQLATSHDPTAQRRGMARLKDHLLTPEQGLAEIVQLYRVQILKELLEQGRSPCISSEAGCRGEVQTLRTKTQQELKRLEKEVPAESQKLLKRGVILAGSNAKILFSYGPRVGLSFPVEYTPRLLQILSAEQLHTSKKRH